MNDTSSKSNAAKGTNVQVAVRCRPVNVDERKSGQPSVVTCDPEAKAIQLSYGPAGKKTIKSFTFDKVFGMYSRQEEVFDSIVRPIVCEVLEGFNCTIFAYGQTGTGKTHTMEGNINSEEDAGIVPRSVKTILESLESSGSEFTIRVSFLELYNEELQDLLNISGEKKLKLCEDVKKGVVCQNLEEITVLSVGDIFEILQRGIQQRQTAATLCNKNSSRSHSIFTMKIMIKECNVEGEEVIRHGQLNLVDLAGSECVGRSGAVNDRAREAGSINQSLLTLGRVITALVDHHGHIPYRDSKLTRLLQESLGGKAKTCIIATLSPSQSAVEETLSTLDYAYRAKSIKNQPTVNQKLTKKVIMKEYLEQVELLKVQLMQTREKNGVYLEPGEFYAMEARLSSQESQLQECEGALASRNEEVKAMRKERDDLALSMQQLTVDYESCCAQLRDTTERLEHTKSEVSDAYVEIASCDAVMDEQASCERELLQQGLTLKGELNDCRGDARKLLQKVALISRSDQEKVDHTNRFVDELAAESSCLLDRVVALMAANREDSTVAQSGVEQMLQLGRTTCSSLRSAIDTALRTMVGQAELTKDDVVASCDGLKLHLNNTSDHLKTTLMELQEQLSTWLASVDSCMGEAQRLSLEQKSGIQAVTTIIHEHCSKLHTNSASFLATQERLRIESEERAEGLMQAIRLQMEDYRLVVEKRSAEAKKIMRDKTDQMEKAMKDMLRDLSNTYTAAVDETSSQAGEVTGSVTRTVADGVHALNESHRRVYSTSADHVEATEETTRDATAAFDLQMSALVQQRDGIESILSSVSATAGAKRTYLQSTVSALSVHADDAIRQSVQAVNRTSTTASGILSDVSEASSSMDRSTAEAMDAFVGFLDDRGDAMTVTLQTHFSTIHEHCQQQQQSMVDQRTAAEQHRNSVMGALVQPTGDTPQKVLESMHQSPFKRTRSHSIIKRDARQVLLDSEGGGVSYDKASREIANRRSLVLSVDVPHADSNDRLVVCGEVPRIVEETQTSSEPAHDHGAAFPSSALRVPDDSAGSLDMDGADSENCNPNIIINENCNPNIMQRQKLPAKATSRTRSRALPVTKGTRSRPEAGHAEAGHAAAYEIA